MKVLTTSRSDQELYIIPRSYPSNVTVRLRNESTNKAIIFDVPTTVVKGYLVFSNTYDLDESEFYELTVYDGQNVIYRDQVFCTNQGINYSMNRSGSTWNTDDEIWDLTENTWDVSGIESIYNSETSYDNDYSSEKSYDNNYNSETSYNNDYIII